MTSDQLMLAAICDGLTDDSTTSAALDAIREESGCTLLAAVLEVARVYNGAKQARELREATEYLADGSAIRYALKVSILAECLNIPRGSDVTIVTIEGDQWPRAEVRRDWETSGHPWCALVTVGALWVKREASRIMVERARAGAAKHNGRGLPRGAKTRRAVK